MKNKPAKPVKKPATKKRKAAQSPVTDETLVTLDKAPPVKSSLTLLATDMTRDENGHLTITVRPLLFGVTPDVTPDNTPKEESQSCSDDYTDEEIIELRDYLKSCPSTWAFSYFGAIAALPAGKLLAHMKRGLNRINRRSENADAEMNVLDAETGRLIREQFKQGSDPASFFSHLALWFKTPEGTGKRRALKLGDFGIKKGKGRQKQPTDNGMLFSWAVTSLAELRIAQGRRNRITHDEIRDQIAFHRLAAGGENKVGMSETQLYKLIRESGFKRFVK